MVFQAVETALWFVRFTVNTSLKRGANEMVDLFDTQSTSK
jgi:hypothetical protein